MKLYTVVKKDFNESEQFWNFSRRHWTGRFSTNCVVEDWDRAKRVLQYQATNNYDPFEEIKLATYGPRNYKAAADV